MIAKPTPLTSEESELLCLLNLARPSPEAERRARHLGADADWCKILSSAKEGSALLLTAKRAAEWGAPTEALAPFESAVRELRARGEARARGASDFLAEASGKGIEIILLKGGLFGPLLYDDSAYKKMNDIDVLVRFGDASMTADILRDLGYASVGQLLGKREIDPRSHHAPPFVSRDGSTLIGLHWNLTSPHSRWKPDPPSLWKRRAEIDAYGTRAYRMGWEENLLHLCIHLPFFKTGVRELSDVYNLALLAEAPSVNKSDGAGIDWRRFDRLVREWRAEDAAYRVLSLADALVPFGLPRARRDRWKRLSSGFCVRDTEARLALGRGFVSLRSVQIGRVEKAHSVFRLSRSRDERLAAWARTWKETFLPPDEELPRLLAGGDRPRWLSRIRAGAACWNAMARDYGHLPLALITAANAAQAASLRWGPGSRARGAPIAGSEAARILEALE